MIVLKHGKNFILNKVMKCKECECEFQFDETDLEECENNLYVKCPECGKYIYIKKYSF